MLLLSETRSPDNKLISSMTNYVNNKNFRIDIKGDEANQSMIYNSATGVYWVFDHNQKTYRELTKADIIKAKKQMEAQLKNVPPQQRAMMEKMMQGKMGGDLATPQITYNKTGTKKAGKWNCTVYSVIMNGNKISELYTV
ncbi:hypothetical protein ACFL52_02585, partial [Candidatus Margulisiibacteriota bacterium]